jgi:hypothetical protein
MKYDVYTKSVAAVDSAHETTGEMHGIRLNDAVDYLVLGMITMADDLFGHEQEAENSADSNVPAGPSMSTFYENLGRVVPGDRWFYGDPDTRLDFLVELHRLGSKFQDHCNLSLLRLRWIHCCKTWY